MNKRVPFILFTFLVLPVIVLLVAEIFLYFLGYTTTYEQEDPFLGFQAVDPLFEKRPALNSASEPIFVTRNSKLPWFNSQQFRAVKPENGYRIFCFGGSTTYGRPYIFKTAFPNWLQVLLHSLDPSTYYEVINVGGVSYASYRIINLMKEMVDYQPDVFVVYSGHNEFLEERTYSDILEESPFVTHVRIRLNRLRTYSLARNIWLSLQGHKREQAQHKYQMTGEVSAILDQSFGLDQYQREPEKAKAILNHFRFNLERMIEIAENHGIAILFIVPPSNEKDFSPFKSQWLPVLNANQIKQWKLHYQTGRTKLSQGDYHGALHSFQQAAEIDSGHADLRYRMGRCLFALGQYQKAKYEFVQARDLDVAPLRSTTEIQQIVREIGHKHGIPTIDLVAILESNNLKHLGHAILGKEFFLDHAHPTIAVHQLIAEELAKAMVKHNLMEPKKLWQDVNRTALYDSVIATIDSTYYGLRDLNLAKVLDWAGKRSEATPFIIRAAKSLPNHPEAQYLLGLVYQDQGRLEQAKLAYQKAIINDSTYAKAYNALGTLYEKNNLLEQALSFFQAAIRHQPDYDHAYYNLGNTLYKKGLVQEAIQDYQQALKLNPHHSKALNNLGVIYMMEGALQEAINAFEETLKLEPENFKAYSNLGVIYFKQGDWVKARAMFQKVLEIQPGDGFAIQWVNRLNKIVK